MNRPTDIHIMIDIETLSNDIRNGVVMALGAIVFRIEVPIVPPVTGEYAVSTNGDRFFLPIEIAGQRAYGLETEPDTVNWWFGSDDRCRIMAAYMSSMYTRPIMAVFEAFSAWVMDVAPKEKTIYMWSHGVTYDCMHLAEKWPKVMDKKFDLCPFRQFRDTRTLFGMYEAKFGKSSYPENTKVHPMKHHPLHDAYVQALAVQKALQELLT